jgi:hypothetical protein
MVDFGYRMPELKMPSFPKREQDCPALDVCMTLGTARETCRKGSQGNPLHLNQGCLPSTVLLLARLIQQKEQAPAAPSPRPPEPEAER